MHTHAHPHTLIFPPVKATLQGIPLFYSHDYATVVTDAALLGAS